MCATTPGSSSGDRSVEQATVADHPAVAPVQRLGIIRRQAFLPTEHRQSASASHEWILYIRKHNDTSAIQSLQRWRQINARHLLETRETGSDIAAVLIDKARAQRLQHTGATVVGGAAAQANIDSLCPGTNRTEHQPAHAIGCSSQRRRLRARRVPDARGFGHLNNS